MPGAIHLRRCLRSCVRWRGGLHRPRTPRNQDAHATSKRKYNTKGADFDYFPRHAFSSFAQRRLAVLFRPYNDGLASFLGRPLPTRGRAGRTRRATPDEACLAAEAWLVITTQ